MTTVRGHSRGGARWRAWALAVSAWWFAACVTTAPPAPTALRPSAAVTPPAIAGAEPPRILFDRTSPFARVLVSDEGGLRVLRFDSLDASTQSAIVPGQPRAVPVEYVRYALLGLAHHGHPTRVLMVGLGGGTFSTMVHRALPAVAVDVVEIDAVVVEAARAYFDLREDARYRIHLADAAEWMVRTGDSDAYDFILLDAYGGDDIPDALGSAAFFRAVARRLRPGGVVALNIAQPEGRGAAVVGNFRAVLPPFDCRQTPHDGNIVVFGAARPRALDRAAMGPWLSAWDARAVTDFSLRALADDSAGRTKPDCDRLLSMPPPAESPRQGDFAD